MFPTRKELQESLKTYLKTNKRVINLLDKYKNNPRLLDNVLDSILQDLMDEINPYRYEPVSPMEFLENPYYGGFDKTKGFGVFDKMYPVLKTEFAHVHDFKAPYREVICTGSLGWGKTFFIAAGLVWHVYLLSCLKNPQDFLQQAKACKISIMIISITEKQAKKNIYHDVKEMILHMPYFQENFKFDMKKATESLIFPNGIELFAGTSAQSSSIGLNIFSAALDEANFFRIIQQSKRSRDSTGIYDEALVLYFNLLQRQETRFLKNGVRPGYLYMASSNVYPDDFTARRIKAAKESKLNTTYVMNYNIWQVNRDAYSKEEFQVEVGGLNRRSRILTGYETDVTGQVINVPIDFKGQFVKDIDNAIRNIAGIALYSVQPFFGQREKIQAMFDSSMPRIFSVDQATLSPKPEFTAVERILPHKIVFPNKIRYIGMDFGLKRDKFGFAMGYIEEMRVYEKEVYDDIEQKEKVVKVRLPIIRIEMVLEIYPEKEFGEVEYGRVRFLILKLKKYGYKIKYTSADGFQSKDMEQILKRNGIKHTYISVDKTTEPYETFRNALYEERVKCIYHEKLEKEMNELEKNYVEDIIDHPKGSSKDICDSVCQLVYNCHINSDYIDEALMPLSIDNNFQTNYYDQYDEDKVIEEFNKWVRS